ncbi:MAG: bifunctional folylpolyglutamate synthase/dihydrofolate synthase [Cyclobacteriaceae bacterium]
MTAFESCLDYLYQRLPVYQRQGPAALKPDLSNTYALLSVLGNPHLKLKTVHIAGTNGKGTTAHALSAVLQASGYKTGLYTSPHLKNFTERIRINGNEIGEDWVINFVDRIKPHIEKINPSFFEVTVAMAFSYFENERIDIGIIETGLGGRLDSTNVITPLVSVITNIGYDHTNLLGNTLEEIASEKAGIIKEKVPVVIGTFQGEVAMVFNEKASSCQSELIFADRIFEVESVRGKIRFENVEIQPDIKADYFSKNIPAVLAAVDELQKSGFRIDQSAVLNGLENIVNYTGLKGRFQLIQSNPSVIADVSHNVDGIMRLMEQVTTMLKGKLFVIYGAVADKDVSSVIREIPSSGHLMCCSMDLPRAMSGASIAEKVESMGRKADVFPDVNSALTEARRLADANDIILITGSTFAVAALKEL